MWYGDMRVKTYCYGGKDKATLGFLILQSGHLYSTCDCSEMSWKSVQK